MARCYELGLHFSEIAGQLNRLEVASYEEAIAILSVNIECPRTLKIFGYESADRQDR